MAGQSMRMGVATAITPTTILVIDKSEMLRAFRAEHDLSGHFIGYMLVHNIRAQEELIVNSNGKRLARTLHFLVRYGKQEQPDRVLPKVFQETLGEMTEPRYC